MEEIVTSINILLFDLLFYFGWTMIFSGCCAFILNILMFYQIFHNKKLKILPTSHLLSAFSIFLVIIEWILFLLFIIDFNCSSFGEYSMPPEYRFICIKPTVNLILFFLMVFGIICLFIANYIDFFSKYFVTKTGKKKASSNLKTLLVTINDL